MKKLSVIKVGGAILENAEKFGDFLDGFAAIEGSKILVHGGGRDATRIATKLGVETRMVDGRRLTDAPMLEIVVMTYGGLLNKSIVARLQSKGVNAIGVTGADLNLVTASKRPIKNGIDYGFVGDVETVNTEMFIQLLEIPCTPILAPLSYSISGTLLNTNADTMASAIAVALSVNYDVDLIYCFEKEGVLKDPENESSIIPEITTQSFDVLKSEGIVTSGMLPKIENALTAVGHGVKRVIIQKYDKIGCMDCGTIIKLN